MVASRLKLAFNDAVLEKKYRADYDYRNRRFNRLGCLISIGVWIIISASSYFVVPTVYPRVLFISFALVLPVLLMVTVLTYFRRLTPFIPWASGLANMVTAFAFLYLSFSLYYNQVFLTSGMLLMSLYAFFIFRLRVRIAVLATTSYIVVYQALMIGRGLSPQDQYVTFSTIWITQAVFVISGYLMERTSRDLFLSTKALSDRNNEIERELVIARMIMENLLPKDIASLHGIRAEALYIPMDRVGGDFYGIRTHGETTELFIADVSGHGLASSYLALVTKLSLDRIPPGSAPDRALEELNRMVCDATVQSNFVTAFLGYLDPAAATLTCASAGHPPALLFRSETGEIMELKTAGRCMGWFHPEKYFMQCVSVRPGDRLVLYTDGVTECRDRNDHLFGEERLKDYILQCIGTSSREFLASLMEALAHHRGGDTFEDDITILVVDID